MWAFCLRCIDWFERQWQRKRALLPVGSFLSLLILFVIVTARTGPKPGATNSIWINMSSRDTNARIIVCCLARRFARDLDQNQNSTPVLAAGVARSNLPCPSSRIGNFPATGPYQLIWYHQRNQWRDWTFLQKANLIIVSIQMALC